MKKLATVATILALNGGCTKPPPPKPPPTAEPAPAPPPAPKCETLEEACKAAPETVGRVGAGWAIAPPPTWVYANASDGMFARADGAALGVTVHEPGDKKAAAKKRDEALGLVAQKSGVTLPKKRIVWPRKPARILTVGTLKVSLYQFGGAMQDGKPGALLVFTAVLPNGKMLLGAGFVLDTDTKDSDQAIMTAIQSLHVEPAA
jgi:hypothetical protein